MRGIKYILVPILALLLGSCIYPYDIELKEGAEGTVTIDGDIIYGEISTFTVGLTQSVADSVSKQFFVNTLYVECEDGTKYQGVNERGDIYIVDTRHLDKEKRYRFVAKISKDGFSPSNARTYMTDFMEVQITPPIDSISYQIAQDSLSVSINVSTHDDSKPEGYYRWEYEENWEFKSVYRATYEYAYYSNSVYEIDFETENRYYCWGKALSRDVLVHSTKNSGSNVVYQEVLNGNIDATDKRLNTLYCIDVIQYSLTEEGYNFWKTLKKNEEGMGDIFSPQPSKPRGNIYCEEDKDEYVIGHIGCSSVTRMRRFITTQEFGIYREADMTSPSIIGREGWQTAYMEGLDVIEINEETRECFWAPLRCVDCRKYGTKDKPDFWPTTNK